jgi:YgiT-type zinc finger domain-containing protein
MCDHETEEIELDEPARVEGDRVYLPGIPHCPSCGDPHDYVVEGLEVILRV